MLLQRGVLNRTLGDDILPPLLVTFGISVIIQNVLLQLFGADTRRLQVGALETASLVLARRHRHRWYFRCSSSPSRSRSSRRCSCCSTARSLGRAFRATSDDADDRDADGRRQPPSLCARHGDRAGGDRRSPASSSPSAPISTRRSARPADLRLRGGDHRRPRQPLGHAGRRRHPRHRPVGRRGARCRHGRSSPAHIAFLVILVLRPQRPLPADAGLR